MNNVSQFCPGLFIFTYLIHACSYPFDSRYLWSTTLEAAVKIMQLKRVFWKHRSAKYNVRSQRFLRIHWKRNWRCSRYILDHPNCWRWFFWCRGLRQEQEWGWCWCGGLHRRMATEPRVQAAVKGHFYHSSQFASSPNNYATGVRYVILSYYYLCILLFLSAVHNISLVPAVVSLFLQL